MPRRGMHRRMLLTLVALAVLAGAHVAMATARVPDPRASGFLPGPLTHGYRAYPTVAAAHAAPATAGTGGSLLSYRGGVGGIGAVTTAPKVVLVFWGSQWGTQHTASDGTLTFGADPAAVAPRLQQLFKGVGTNGETWSGVMTQYCQGLPVNAVSCPSDASHVGYPTGGALVATWADTASPAPTQATEHQLAAEAVRAATALGNGVDRQFVIVSPHNASPDGFNTFFANWCAWHDYNADTALSGGPAASTVGNVAFTNLPYIPDAGSSCGRNYVNSGAAGALDGLTIVAGHEYAETITDPYPAGGWTDASGEENADKCAWVGTGGTSGAQNLTFATGTFAMQATYSNDGASCLISHPVVTNGGSTAADTVTVGPVAGQSTQVGDPVDLTVPATSSAGDAISSYAAANLPPGLTMNAATGHITGSPTTATGSPWLVTVTATDSANTQGTTSFAWTVTSTATTPCNAAQLLGNPGFESGVAAPWSATGRVINSLPIEPARNGSWDAWLDGYGTTHTDVLSQTVTLPTGCTSYTLSFWLHIDSAEITTTTQLDRLTVSVGGTPLATYSNLNRAVGYVQKSFNLRSFAGKTVTIKFSASENSSRQTSFVVDDTALSVAP